MTLETQDTQANDPSSGRPIIHLPKASTHESQDTGKNAEQPAHEQNAGTKVNVNQPERAVSALLGATLIGLALERRSLGGTVMGLAGASLLYRGVSGHCHVYQALDVNTAERRPGGASDSAQEFASIQASVTIAKSADEIYRLWRDPSMLSQIIKHFAEVTEAGEGRMHWVVQAPLGQSIEWDSNIVEDRPGELLKWKSLPEARLTNEGSLELRPARANRGTIATLKFRFDPPGGALGNQALKLLSIVPKTLALVALQRLRSLAETGEIPTTDGQPSGREAKSGKQGGAQPQWLANGKGVATTAAAVAGVTVLGVLSTRKLSQRNK